MSQPLDATRKGAPVEKVTVFVMGERMGVKEALFLYHPNAGIQLPAGTVEAGESAQVAAMREAQEETGLPDLVWGGLLGAAREEFAPNQAIVTLSTPVYIRPDAALYSYATAMLRRGIMVEVVSAEGDFVQVRFAETDRYPDAQYTTFEVMGWVPANTLSGVRVRYFAWLSVPTQTPPSWTHLDDQHTFTLRWHPLDALPELVAPQAWWMRYLPTG